MALVGGLTSEQRECFEELVAEFGAPAAETILAVLEDACGAEGTEWPVVVADWTANGRPTSASDHRRYGAEDSSRRADDR